MDPFKFAAQAPEVTVAVDDVRVRYRVPSSEVGARAALPRPVRVAHRLLGREPSVVVRALSGVSQIGRASCRERV